MAASTASSSGSSSTPSSFADEAKRWMRRVSSSASETAPPSEKRGPSRVGFLGIGRDRHLLVWARDAQDESPQAPILSERYAALGRKMVGRTDPPGWDDISESGLNRAVERGGGGIRCISLPVHDLQGTTKYVIAFGATFPVGKAQSLAERLALMLGPLVDQELANAPAGGPRRLAPEAAANFRQVLNREIATANSQAAIYTIQNQVEQVRSIMERNVEMILDRGEKLENLENKSDQLSQATLAFKKQARKLKRWHLMNQVKWGVAVGTIVTASIAIPITALALA